MIRWKCSACREMLEAPESLSDGSLIACPHCRTENIVPNATSSALMSMLGDWGRRLRSKSGLLCVLLAFFLGGLFIGFSIGRSTEQRYWYGTFKRLGVSPGADRAANRLVVGLGVWLLRTEHEIGPLENGHYTVFWKAHLNNFSSKVIIGTLKVEVQNAQGFVVGTFTDYEARLSAGEQTLRGEVKVPEARYELIDRIDVSFSYVPLDDK